MACARLEVATYPVPEVATLLKQYIPVKVDFTVEPELGDRFGVQSSPDIFLLTADGQVVNRITRFVEAAPLAAFLKSGLVAPEASHSSAAVPWAKSFAAAESASKASGKPIFVYVWNYG